MNVVLPPVLRFLSVRRSFPYVGVDAPKKMLIEVAGLAERLGVGERFVRRLVEERRIPFLKIGRHIRFDADEVEHWIRTHKVEASRAEMRVRAMVRS